MNRFQLYELVESKLLLLLLNAPESLCGMLLYEHLGGSCINCIFYSVDSKAHCQLNLQNTSAQQLKADIIVKHPELLI